MAKSHRIKRGRVEIYTLGRFEVRINGALLPKKRKAPHRLLELLQAVVTMGGCAVPVSWLIDQLWPQSDADRAMTTFKKTVKRLRNYLKVESVLDLNHGAVTLDPSRCWVDVWTFERELRQAQEDSGPASTTPWRAHLRKALALYRGPFLPEQTKPWATASRMRLRGDFIRNVARLSDHWQQRGQSKQAIEWLNRGLQVDPYAEALYVPLIDCLQANGRKTEAHAVYHQCAKLLLGELKEQLPLEILQFQTKGLDAGQ